VKMHYFITLLIFRRVINEILLCKKYNSTRHLEEEIRS
jgi:hypothetical protein